MKEMSEKSLKSLESKIRKKFHQTGFPTEEQTSMVLLKNGWHIVRNVRYYDKTLRRYGEIDITAFKTIKKSPLPVELILVIECKKQEKHPWVFVESSVKLLEPFSINFVCKEKYVNEVFRRIKRRFSDHYYFDKTVSTFHLSPFFLFSNKHKTNTQDPIRKAINQILRHTIETFSREFSVAEKAVPFVEFIYPVIVFNGNLLFLSKDEKISVVDHIIYLTNMSPGEALPLGRKIRRFKPFVIDIVTPRYLEKFIKLIENKGVLF